MSGHRPARTRLMAASMLGILAALAGFVVMITVRYRDGLQQRLRSDLTAGAGALLSVHEPIPGWTSCRRPRPKLVARDRNVAIRASAGPGSAENASALVQALLDPQGFCLCRQL